MAAAVIILSVLIIIILLLFIPLKVELRGSVHNDLDLKLKFKYLFGLVSWESKGGKKQVHKEPGGEDVSGDYSWLPHLYNASQTEELWTVTWKFVKRLWGRVKTRNVDIDLAVSLGDDYYTGTIAGFLIPVCLLINRQFATDIRLQPAFEEELFIKGYINADWQVVPGTILAPCLAFFLSKPFRQARCKYYA